MTDFADHLQSKAASTQRGFVWNSRVLVLHDCFEAASTQRGFVWNRRWRASPTTGTGLQPNEGSSGTRGPVPRHRRRQCFNPTRVRLEPSTIGFDSTAGACFNPTRVRLERGRPTEGRPMSSASTQRGFVWNRRRDAAEIVVDEASTQRGFVWNCRSSCRRLHRRQLQPNEGSSGTMSESRLSVISPRLQPNEGSSGTATTGGILSSFGRLQPNEGSSGTNRLDTHELLIDALQPNEGSSGTRALDRVRIYAGGFNPTRVRLELGMAKQTGNSNEASTQRGFVWNADVEHCDGSSHRLQPNEGSSGTSR